MPRLPRDAVKYIKYAQASYSEIIQQVRKQWNRNISKGLVSYYRGSRTGRTKPLHKENIDQSEWDWLVGVYYTDGCKFMDRYHHIVVFTLSSRDIEIRNKLVSILEKMGLKVRVYPKRNEKAIDVKICSKHLYLALPNKEDDYVPNFPLAYLAGLFDGDGHIKKYASVEKWIFTQAKYPHLAKQVIGIVQQYGGVTTRLIHHQNSTNKPTYKVSLLKEARKALSSNEFAKYSIRCKLVVGRAGLS